jgi:hypothetical protein
VKPSATDRVVASFATGPVGRFVAFWVDLGAALLGGLRRRRAD